MTEVEASLRRLNTDRIDVYMLHWPDYDTTMEETLRALDDLVRSGKIRYIACSSLETWDASPMPSGRPGTTVSKPLSRRRSTTNCSSAMPTTS